MRRDGFLVQALDSSSLQDFNIVEWEFEDNEFLLGVLWGDNGFRFHVCCFSKNMIVDSNHQQALYMKQEALNIICQCDYKRLYQCLYFHKRKNQPIATKKRKRK